LNKGIEFGIIATHSSASQAQQGKGKQKVKSKYVVSLRDGF
jgi:hypothetical protein